MNVLLKLKVSPKLKIKSTYQMTDDIPQLQAVFFWNSLGYFVIAPKFIETLRKFMGVSRFT